MFNAVLIDTDNVRATIELRAYGKTWTLNIIDDRKKLEPHQIESITKAVQHAFNYMFPRLALSIQTISYDVVTFHDKDCYYSFDFRRGIVDVHLK